MSTAETGAFEARNSSRMRSKISTFESTPIPIVKITPAMPGNVSTAPKYASAASNNTRFKIKRDHRVHSGQPVVDDHENHHDEQADDRSLHAVTNRIRAQRRADGALFQILDRCRKRSGTQNQAKIVRFLLAELAFDYAGIVDAAVDDRRCLKPCSRTMPSCLPMFCSVKGPKRRPASVESVKSTS